MNSSSDDISFDRSCKPLRCERDTCYRRRLPLMPFSRKASTYLVATCLILTFALYYYTFKSYSHVPFLFSKTSPASEYLLSKILNPHDHIHRAVKNFSFEFNVTQGYRRPDGVKKLVYLINGEFPGPTIEARSGDELEIRVLNNLENDEGIAIHWHGLSMRWANGMDGVVGLTQSAIAKSESFTYRFRIEDTQSGTFWYHAHSDAQRSDGMYGALIVHSPTALTESGQAVDDHDEEQILLIGDWYHRSAREVVDYYKDWNNFGNEPAPDSILINGHGAFDCSMAVAARPLDCVKTESPQLKLNGDRSRLRVINTGALTGFNISVSGHGMKVIQADGGNPVEMSNASVSIGILYPGERIDVLIERIENVDLSVLTVALDPENMKFPNLALNPIQEFPVQSRMRHTVRTATISSSLDLTDLIGEAPSKDSALPNAKATLLFYTKIEILAQFRNIPKGFINRTSWQQPDMKSAPLLALDPHEWNSSFVPEIASGPDQWVDIVVNNMDDKGHPFHLHGYDFYVLSSHKAPFGSYEAYNPFDASAKPAGGPMNTKNPLKKDTIFVPSMGYVVLRLLADNEGLWFFHCHVLWHEVVGMAMAFHVSGNAAANEETEQKRTRASELCRLSQVP